MRTSLVVAVLLLAVVAPEELALAAQTPTGGSAPQAAAQQPAPARKPAAPGQPPAPTGVTPPPGYVIGPEDVLAVVFWREKDLSVDETVVRPDGMITLPILNDVKAAGLTPEELRKAVEEAAGRYVQEPNATVVIKAINSRRFFITGMVNKPGPYGLGGPTTILQAIAMAGGLQDFAKENDIVLMRQDGAKTATYKFRYKDVIKGKNLQQNIEVRPGDTIVVP